MKKFDISLLTIAVVIVGLVILGVNQKPAATEELAATVNGQPITKAEYYKALESRDGIAVVTRLITNALVEQEAKRLNVTVDPAEVDKDIQEYKDKLGEKQFELLLKTQHLANEKELWERQRISLLGKKIIEIKTKETGKKMKSAELVKELREKANIEIYTIHKDEKNDNPVQE